MVTKSIVASPLTAIGGAIEVHFVKQGMTNASLFSALRFVSLAHLHL